MFLRARPFRNTPACEAVANSLLRGREQRERGEKENRPSDRTHFLQHLGLKSPEKRVKAATSEGSTRGWLGGRRKVAKIFIKDAVEGESG
jgi:hypothetical protein